MKIKVLPRVFFEKIKGSSTEKILLENSKIILICSSFGDDMQPPFSEQYLSHCNLLVQTFDDVTIDDFPGCQTFSLEQAREILRFVDPGEMPLLIHCTAGISRSGALGDVLNWYFNRYLENNQNDYDDFIRNNRQIIPNHIVRKILLEVIENE